MIVDLFPLPPFGSATTEGGTLFCFSLCRDLVEPLRKTDILQILVDLLHDAAALVVAVYNAEKVFFHDFPP